MVCTLSSGLWERGTHGGKDARHAVASPTAASLICFSKRVLNLRVLHPNTEKSPMTPTPFLYRGPETSQARQWEGGIRTICGSFLHACLYSLILSKGHASSVLLVTGTVQARETQWNPKQGPCSYLLELLECHA